MAFDASSSSCQVEQHTGLPVCQPEPSDVQILHANIAVVVSYMADHHIPRDPWDGPYVFRDYLPEMISANDVAALSRIGAAATARAIDLPPVLVPLYSGTDAPVTDQDVYYVADRARDIAEVLGPVLSAMRAYDTARGCGGFPWGWVVAASLGGVLLGVLTAHALRRDREGEDRRRAREKTA